VGKDEKDEKKWKVGKGGSIMVAERLVSSNQNATRFMKSV